MNLEPLIHSLAKLDQCAPTFSLSPEREDSFKEIAQFLESHARAGQSFDLKAIQPNPLWMLLEDRLSAALDAWEFTRPVEAGAGLIRQWYSSGVIIETDGLRLGFDIIPIPRAYEWPDRHNLADRLADLLDVLLITHRHHDHYDENLVRACLERDVPVYLPESLARQWKESPLLHPVVDGQQWLMPGLQCSARIGPHVWRDTIDELPVCIYVVIGADGKTWVYGGDADYTRLPDLDLRSPVKAYFLPWRAPNARYESGHDMQTGSLPDALDILLAQVRPEHVFYQHCAELEHVHDGFPASFDMALDLKRHCPMPSELMFWGESIDLGRS